jgi:hypothetical protein
MRRLPDIELEYAQSVAALSTGWMNDPAGLPTMILKSCWATWAKPFKINRAPEEGQW